jgi:nitroreductase
MLQRASAIRDELRRRRTVRQFSDRPVPRQIIEDSLLAAGSAPNGANKQPWHFEVVGDPAVKKKIREAAEAEERKFYGGRASDEWLRDLEAMGTDANKPFLATAPWLIAIFEQRHSYDAEGNKIRHYYTKESVGIATGMLITALHHSGLATLTHTPNPMGFLNKILERPAHEKPFLLLVVGYPAADAQVPDIEKKSLAEMANFR